jgi:hypothetical protein
MINSGREERVILSSYVIGFWFGMEYSDQKPGVAILYPTQSPASADAWVNYFI